LTWLFGLNNQTVNKYWCPKLSSIVKNCLLILFMTFLFSWSFVWLFFISESDEANWLRSVNFFKIGAQLVADVELLAIFLGSFVLASLCIQNSKPCLCFCLLVTFSFLMVILSKLPALNHILNMNHAHLRSNNWDYLSQTKWALWLLLFEWSIWNDHL